MVHEIHSTGNHHQSMILNEEAERKVTIFSKAIHKKDKHYFRLLGTINARKRKRAEGDEATTLLRNNKTLSAKVRGLLGRMGIRL